MNCERWGPLLSLYHDGVLDPARREEMRAHLHECPFCTARLAEYRLLDRRVAGAFSVQPSPRFTRAVLAATGEQDLAAVRAARRNRAGRRRAQMIMGGLTGASAAGLIALALGVVANLPPARVAHPSAVARAVRVSIPESMGSPRRPSVHDMALTTPHAPRGVIAFGTPARETRNLAYPIAARPAFTEATIPVHATHVDRAALLHITSGAPLPGPDAVGPLWSGDSRSLLYLTDWRADPQTGWMVGTLMRYSPAGTVRIHDLVRDFAWSPDDRSIVYAAQTPDAGADNELAQDLHIVRAGGSGDRVLCRVDRASVEYLGDHITAVQQGRPVSIDPVTGASSPLGQIPAVRIAGADSGFWALSAGERFFAYQDSAGLRVWDRARGGMLVLRNSLARFAQASFHFSWDGREIFYSTFDGHYTRLYRQSLDPLESPQPLAGGRPLHGPILQVGAPSPDGTLLNYRTGQNSTALSYVIDTRHGLPHLLLPPGDAGVGPVGSWSPDGTRFVYTTYRGDVAVRSAIAQIAR